MSKKIAILVRTSFVTRVIVDEFASEQEILEVARPKLFDQVEDELYENVEEFAQDMECPYDPSIDTPVYVTSNKYEGLFNNVHSNKSNEVLEELKKRYVDSDVTSGEFINGEKFDYDTYQYSDVVIGTRQFLNWDESRETFDIERNGDKWVIKNT